MKLQIRPVLLTTAVSVVLMMSRVTKARQLPVYRNDSSLSPMCVLELSNGGLIENSEIFSIAFLPGSDTILTGSGGGHYGSIKYWSLASKKMIRDLTVYEGPVYQIQSSKDGKIVVGFSYQHAILWSGTTGVFLKAYSPPCAGYFEGALTPDGRYFAVSGASMIDAGNKYFTVIYDNFKGRYKSRRKLGAILDSSPDGDSVVCRVGSDIRIYSIKKDRIIHLLGRCKGARVCYSSDGSKLALIKNGQVVIYNTTDWSCTNTIKQTMDHAETIRFIANDTQIAVAYNLANSSETGNVDLFDIISGNRTHHLAYAQSVSMLGVSHERNLLAVVQTARVEVFKVLAQNQ